MSVCTDVLRHWDAPVPLVVSFWFTPAFVVSGFLVARRHGGQQGVAAGAAAEVTAHVVVYLVASAYAAVNESWLSALGSFMTGLAFLPATLMWGVLCGCAGAGVAHVVGRLSTTDD
jgi:hypothetical protein